MEATLGARAPALDRGGNDRCLALRAARLRQRALIFGNLALTEMLEDRCGELVVGDVLLPDFTGFAKRRRGQHDAAVADLHGSVEQLVDVDHLATRGESGRRALDELNGALVMNGEVVREPALLLPMKHFAEIVLRAKRRMRVVRARSRAPEAPVVVDDEFGSESVRRSRVRDPAQTKLFTKRS